MVKYYYRKSASKSKKYLRLISILILTIGASILFYVLFPIVSWQIYFMPAFASQNITPSIPYANIVDLVANSIDKTDYTKAENWFPKFNPLANSGQKIQTDVPFYTISIPKLNIDKAIVSDVDTDLAKHLVNYPGTGIPGRKGNAVIFGHSSLPQLFNEKDYKTIFSTVYKLKDDDVIFATVNNITYSYKIFKIMVIDPSDTEQVFIQDYSNYNLTLVTCTPPGTTWKRLIIKARLEKI